MDNRTLKTLGILFLLAGLAVSGFGAYEILTNLPLTDTLAPGGVDRALAGAKGGPDSPKNASLQEDLERQVRETTLPVRNEDRRRRRGEGIGWIVSGMIVLMWGGTMLLNNRSTTHEP